MFPPGTLLSTENGPVDVRKLHGNERLQVACPGGPPAFRQLRRIYMGGAPGKLFCISTGSGLRFCATPDQPFAVGMHSTRGYHDLLLVKREGLGFFLVVGNGLFRDNLEARILLKRQELATKESVWLLASFPGPNQANYEQALLSCQYGIPVFPAGPRRGERTLPDELFRRLLIEVNTFGRARRLLGDHHLDEELPHWLMRALPEAELPHRRLLDVVYFGGAGGKHVLTEHPLGEKLRIAGEKLRNLITRHAEHEALEERSRVALRVEAARRDPLADVQERIKLGGSRPHFLLPLAYARPGMVCMTAGSGAPHEEHIEQALFERYEGPVFGIELEGDEPLVAGGLVMGLAKAQYSRPGASPEPAPAGQGDARG